MPHQRLARHGTRHQAPLEARARPDKHRLRPAQAQSGLRLRHGRGLVVGVRHGAVRRDPAHRRLLLGILDFLLGLSLEVGLERPVDVDVEDGSHEGSEHDDEHLPLLHVPHGHLVEGVPVELDGHSEEQRSCAERDHHGARAVAHRRQLDAHQRADRHGHARDYGQEHRVDGEVEAVLVEGVRLRRVGVLEAVPRVRVVEVHGAAQGSDGILRQVQEAGGVH
mmetsp:Transcript_20852/g.62126  ORF Transcript_20852/g.62126 Transcript_20852/m.62126 type:complete len:222 (+) Transcript_20852:838-1503(+)